MNRDNELDSLIETFFDEYYYTFSSFATVRGIHRYDYKLSSLTKADLKRLNEVIDGTLNSLKSIEEKNKNIRQQDLKVVRKFLINLKNFLDDGLNNFPQFFVASIVYGVITSALTQAKQISIRSRNFASRIGDIKSVENAIREFVYSTSALENEVNLWELNQVSQFIDEFSSYVLTKSDVEKKDIIKNERRESKEILESISNYLSSVRKDNFALNIKQYVSSKNLENIDFLDLKKHLLGSLESLKNEIIKKAREIRITAPFFETLQEEINRKDKITEEEISKIIQLIEAYQTKFFGNKLFEVNSRIIIENSDIYKLFEFANLHILPSGEFDNKKEMAILLNEDENINKVILDIISLGLLGKGYVNFSRQSIKTKRKFILNAPLYEGFPIYIRRLAFEEIKKDLSKSFELYYYYYEYLTTLLAYIENEIYFRNISIIEIEKLIEEDKILIDKEAFRYKLVFDMGDVFLGMQGLYRIVELKNMKKTRLEDFHFKLIQNMHNPFYVVREVIKWWSPNLL